VWKFDDNATDQANRIGCLTTKGHLVTPQPDEDAGWNICDKFHAVHWSDDGFFMTAGVTIPCGFVPLGEDRDQERTVHSREFGVFTCGEKVRGNRNYKARILGLFWDNRIEHCKHGVLHWYSKGGGAMLTCFQGGWRYQEMRMASLTSILEAGNLLQDIGIDSIPVLQATKPRWLRWQLR
jgi:hypothetical protein